MLKLATIPGQAFGSGEIPWAQRYRKVALKQRELAEMTSLPRVREQLLLSAEKWEYLAESQEAKPGLA